MSPRGSAPLVRSGSVNRLWTTSGEDEQVTLRISRLRSEVWPGAQRKAHLIPAKVPASICSRREHLFLARASEQRTDACGDSRSPQVGALCPGTAAPCESATRLEHLAWPVPAPSSRASAHSYANISQTAPVKDSCPVGPLQRTGSE